MSKDKKKLTQKQYEQKIKEQQEYIAELEGTRSSLETEVLTRTAALETVTAAHGMAIKDRITLQDKNKDLEDRLERAERRLDQAIDAVDNSAIATAAVSRVTNALGTTIDALELRLSGENKPSGRYPRG